MVDEFVGIECFVMHAESCFTIETGHESKSGHGTAAGHKLRQADLTQEDGSKFIVLPEKADRQIALYRTSDQSKHFAGTTRPASSPGIKHTRVYD
jgi:hypothetical protein